jgi:serine/threonine-protein kinase ATR
VYHAAKTNHIYLEHMEVLFSNILRLLDTAKPPTKQTMLIIVGSLGKYVPFQPPAVVFVEHVYLRSTNTDILCKVVCCLISQLGKANPVLKATAYMQVGLFVAVLLAT